MKFYITQETKQEIEDKIAELEKFYNTARKVDITMEKIDWEIEHLKEVLSFSTILPVEESWESVSDYMTFSGQRYYPQGVIIQSKQ